MVSANRNEQFNEHDWENWLASCWEGEFQHSYAPRRRGRSTRPNELWHVKNLQEALRKYKWGKADFAETSATLDSLSERLKNAITSNNNENAMNASLEILGWGKVDTPTKLGENRTVTWLQNSCKSGSLVGRLQLAIDSLLTGDLDDFNGSTLIMNSGATKVFSLADPSNRIVIYDGRVGAALGFLARTYLMEREIPTLPHELNFLWGAAKTSGINRDPSTERYKFGRLFGTRPDHKHASMVYESSKLIGKVASRTNTSPRQWEASLFMAGYAL